MTMDHTKLCLLLLLSAYALAQEDAGSAEEASPTCLLAKRYKSFRNYVYMYEAETFNTVSGTSNGAKASCRVEIDVPQTCSFVLRTTECSLSEVTGSDEEGNAVYTPVAENEAFAAAMEKNVLKVVVEGETEVKLFAEQDESTDILNIKRGIISALMVPTLDETKNNKMATIHGVCDSVYQVNAREDIATDVTVTRDLSDCDSFHAHRDATSPLAMITGMHLPLSQLIKSSQTCNYQFDNRSKHMTSASCVEKHLLLPFSNQGHGVNSEVKQTLTLQGTTKINDRIFDVDESRVLGLHMEETESKSPVQTAVAIKGSFQELVNMGETSGHQRASVFQRLVSELRELTYETMRPVLQEMLDAHPQITFQALVQCGTPDCMSATLQTLRYFEPGNVEIDVLTYALGMLAHPSARLTSDLLESAKYKQSRPIMFALSNMVRKVYQAEGKVTPEIAAVYEYMSSILGADCGGDKELTLLTLRVIGNMGEAMEAADAGVKSTLVKCMRQPATTLSVQMAAINAFRRMTITDEVRSNIQRVAQYGKGAVQKRLAAYLVLMRQPEPSDYEMLRKILGQDQNPQVKAFVASHVNNIINSNDPATHKLGEEIAQALSDIEITSGDLQASHNYRMDTAVAKDATPVVQGNVIFDPSSQLPREVMLETTLKAFGSKFDIFEFGMEGKGFEPAIDALFGKSGFFPDTLSKAMYWTGDKMPQKMVEVLEGWGMSMKTDKQVPENFVREIVRNFNKLAKNLRAQEAPEAMAYLRIMGTELGYIKANEMEDLSYLVAMYGEILSYLLPKDFLKQLTSDLGNSMTAYYMFLDNEFQLPTAAGLPLRAALSGTLVPRMKGALTNFGMRHAVQELSFMPSVGVEFVTKMGVHVPQFVDAGLEMHTNLYHESSVRAKLQVANNQVKLSVPAPEGPTQLFRVSNRLLSVSAGQAQLVPSAAEGRTNVQECAALFKGMKYCTTARYNMAAAEDAPYFPLNGETKFAIDVQPTGDVSEYTATVTYDVLSEGKEGRQKVDSIKVALKAEGAEPVEASASLKYNRNRNTLTGAITVPDYDVEAGIKVGMTDSKTRGKQITIDISDHTVPKMSLIARAKMEAMSEGLVQLQVQVPSLSTDATFTASLRNDAQLTLEVESDVKLPETNSAQKITFIYGDDSVEVLVKSDMNTEVQKVLPTTESVQNWLHQLSQDILDQRVVKTDMKLRHIYNKAIEASQIWMDKVSADAPFLAQLRENMPEVVVPSIPERLYLQTEAGVKYVFNQNTITVTVPLPMGGKSSEELSIPEALSTPELSIRQVGLMVPSQEFTIPAFTIPSEYDLTLPLFGMLELSARINSNAYNWEAVVSGGNDSAEDAPAYVAKYRITADSPVEILAFTSEGSARIADAPLETLKCTASASLNHKLLDTRFSLEESYLLQETVKAEGKYELEVFSPLGMQTSQKATVQTSLGSEVSGDVNMDGTLTLGSVSGSSSLVFNFLANPSSREGTAESTFRLSFPVAQIRNKMKLTADAEHALLDNTFAVNHETVKHTTKVTVEQKEGQVTVKSDCMTKADESILRHQFDMAATMDKVTVRVDSQLDDKTNRAVAAVTAALDQSGLELNGDASVNVGEHRSAHKGAVLLNRNGLTASCTTDMQVLDLNMDNTVQASVDTTSGAAVSVSGKATYLENSAELKVDGKAAVTEVTLNGLFKGDLFSANTRNLINFRLDRDGLAASNSMATSLNEIHTDTTQSLKVTLDSLKLSSVSDNVLSAGNSYKHELSVELQRLALAVVMNNDLKLLGANLLSEAKVNAEPFKMAATGLLKAAYGQEEVRHTYEISFADRVASVKCSSNGNLLGAQLTHSSEVEVDGLASAKYSGEARLNSPVLRLSGTLAANVVPFTVTVDGILNSDGEVSLYGKQTGELYSKLLLKASSSPRSLTSSLECRASSAHQMDSGVAVETSFQNKMDALAVPEEQSVSVTMDYKVNEHVLSQVLKAYNRAERIGMEVTGTAATNLLNKEGEDNQDFAISGFLKYDKNSDSHFLEIPLVQHLPEILEQAAATAQNLAGNAVSALEQADEQYHIRATLEEKARELKEVVDTFDVELFVRDASEFAEKTMKVVLKVVPTEEVAKVLRSIWDAVVTWVKQNQIAEKLETLYAKVEEVVAQYQFDSMVEKVMDTAVEAMQQYRLKENFQDAVVALQSVDYRPLLEKLQEVQGRMTAELQAFDFQQMLADLKEYLTRLFDNVKSVDFESYAAEAKASLVEMTRVPCFGKLYGEFKITSPEHNLAAAAEFQNSTTTAETPEFSATLSSQLTSTTFDLLAYKVDANAHIAAPKRDRLSLMESIKMSHMSGSVDHQASATLYGLVGQASAETVVKATTEPYAAEFVNKAFVAMENGFSTTLETSYNHKVSMPVADIFSETSVKQKAVAQLEAGTVTVTVANEGTGKYSVHETLADDGFHNSNLEVELSLENIKVTFTGETNTENLKLKQNLNAVATPFSGFTATAHSEGEAPAVFVKSSVVDMKVEGQVEEPKLLLTATHNTEFVGQCEGIIAGSVEFEATPLEVRFDSKYKDTGKFSLPLDITGKMDLQSDVTLLINPAEQKASWTHLARFNQYKYSHFLSAGNAEKDMHVSATLNGEAALDMLMVPIEIPAMTVPFVGISTPSVESVSVWDAAGLERFLITPQQTFSLESKWSYTKNPEMMTVEIDMAPVLNAINVNADVLRRYLEQGKDSAADVLAASFNQAKQQYEKLPKTINLPGFTIPVANLEVSPNSIAVPDLSAIPMPALPAVSLRMPQVSFPSMQQTLLVPTFGELNYVFTMKTAMLTLNANADLLNQDDIVARFSGVSASDLPSIDLNAKTSGSATLSVANGVSLSSALSLQHAVVEGSHTGTLTLNREVAEASVANAAKLPAMAFEVQQELTGNAVEGVTGFVSSPTLGLLGAQMQKKSARVYGRYPSEPEADVDILGVEMNIDESNQLQIETRWNMEVPREMALAVKDRVPEITAAFNVKEMMNEQADAAYEMANNAQVYLQRASDYLQEQAQVVYDNAAEKIAAADFSEYNAKISEAAMMLLQKYEALLKNLLDAAVTVLRQTKIPFPGYEEDMSLFELYNEISTFLGDFAEDALTRIPEMLAAYSQSAVEHLRAVEFTLPGSTHVVNGGEILDDLTQAFSRLQAQIIAVVKDLSAIQLETVMEKMGELVRVSVEKARELVTSVTSQDLEGLTAWLKSVYADFLDSQIFHDVTTRAQQALNVAEQYCAQVKGRFHEVVGDFSVEQLNADLQAWIQSVVERLAAFQTKVVEVMMEVSQRAQGRVTVSDDRVVVTIPLPLQLA